MMFSPRAIAVVLAAAACCTVSPVRVSAQEPAVPTGSTDEKSHVASIAGTVLSAGTDQPLKKTRVSLSGRDGKESTMRTVVTGADGKFAMEGIAPGAYDLNIDHDGYVAKSFGEDSSGQGSAVLTLVAGQKMTDLLFRLQKCAVISGHVTDEDGDPVQNVSVDAVQRVTYRGKTAVATVGQSQTNDLGEFRIFDLRPGRYYIRAKPNASEEFEERAVLSQGGPSEPKPANNYVATYYPNVADVSRASMIELKAGDEIPSMDLSLIRNRTYKLRGQVIDTTGNVEESYAINVMSKDALGFENVTQQMADKNNSFEVPGLSPGSYMLIAIGFGEARSVVKGFEHVEIIDSDVDSVRVVIKRGAEIRGRIVMDGKPALPKVLAISLAAKDNDLGMGGGRARVKADGTFEVRDVLDGPYQIHVQSDCEECYLKSAKMNGVDLLETGLQSVGGTPQPLELVYSNRSGTVDGIVTKDDDLPAVGATVLLVPGPPYREWSGRYKSAATDQHGRFTIRGLAPGEYKAFSFNKADDFVDFEAPEFIGPFEAKGESISIEENGKKTLQLKLIALKAETPPN